MEEVHPLLPDFSLEMARCFCSHSLGKNQSHDFATDKELGNSLCAQEEHALGWVIFKIVRSNYERNTKAAQTCWSSMVSYSENKAV